MDKNLLALYSDSLLSSYSPRMKPHTVSRPPRRTGPMPMTRPRCCFSPSSLSPWWRTGSGLWIAPRAELSATSGFQGLFGTLLIFFLLATGWPRPGHRRNPARYDRVWRAPLKENVHYQCRAICDGKRCPRRRLRAANYCSDCEPDFIPASHPLRDALEAFEDLHGAAEYAQPTPKA